MNGRAYLTVTGVISMPEFQAKHIYFYDHDQKLKLAAVKSTKLIPSLYVKTLSVKSTQH